MAKYTKNTQDTYTQYNLSFHQLDTLKILVAEKATSDQIQAYLSRQSLPISPYKAKCLIENLKPGTCSPNRKSKRGSSKPQHRLSGKRSHRSKNTHQRMLFE